MVLCAGFGTLTPTYKVITSKHKKSFQNVGVKPFLQYLLIKQSKKQVFAYSVMQCRSCTTSECRPEETGPPAWCLNAFTAQDSRYKRQAWLILRVFIHYVPRPAFLRLCHAPASLKRQIYLCCYPSPGCVTILFPESLISSCTCRLQSTRQSTQNSNLQLDFISIR